MHSDNFSLPSSLDEIQRTNNLKQRSEKLFGHQIENILYVEQDIIQRKQALKNCIWMKNAQRKQILITEKGIKIGDIPLALFDDSEEKNSLKDFKYTAPSKETWKKILEFIRGTQGDQFYFFKQVLKMEKDSYGSSSLSYDFSGY